MSLWGNSDQESSKPKYLSDGLRNEQDVSDLDSTFGVDVSEAQTIVNREKGIKTPGWTEYRTYTDAQGNVRHKAETLVAMGAGASVQVMSDATDDTVVEDLVITIDTQPDNLQYIVSPASVTLTVEASSNGTAPLEYQWWDNDTEEKLEGQTSATLTLEDITAPRSFVVEVKSAGAQSVWSEVAQVRED